MLDSISELTLIYSVSFLHKSGSRTGGPAEPLSAHLPPAEETARCLAKLHELFIALALDWKAALLLIFVIW